MCSVTHSTRHEKATVPKDNELYTGIYTYGVVYRPSRSVARLHSGGGRGAELEPPARSRSAVGIEQRELTKLSFISLIDDLPGILTRQYQPFVFFLFFFGSSKGKSKITNAAVVCGTYSFSVS